MASYAKRPVQRDVNKFLVFFLVVFVLTTIGAGLWGYYGYSGQDAINASAEKKSKAADAANLLKDYYSYLTLELRLMLNDPNFSEPDRALWQELRRDFVKGKFEKQKNYKEYADFIDERRKTLGFDDINDKYLHAESARLQVQNKKVNELKADLAAKLETINSFAQIRQNENAKHDQKYRELEKLILDKSKEILDATMQRRLALEEAFARNSELITAMNKDKETHDERERQWLKEFDKLKQEIESLQIELKKPAGQAVARNLTGIPQFLLLDVSMGKPLWDMPLGKIIAVTGDRVLIHVFTDDRAEELLRTGLTFNVFAPGKTGADGKLKGTMEIISLEGGKAAVCRITSRFGGKDNPIVPEDLLFNMTWGTHVVVLGEVNLFKKHRGDGQTELTRNLKHFIATLERQGVIVDAYVDLMDGSFKGKYGKITEKTRFLIRGFDLNERKIVAAAVSEIPDSGDLKKNKNLRDQLEEATKETVAGINRKMAELQKEAVDKGLFIISPENFANVAGYRKIGGYGADEIPFTPSLPTSNAKP